MPESDRAAGSPSFRARRARDVLPEQLGVAGEAYDAGLDRAFAAALQQHEARLVDEAHAALVAEGLAGINDPSDPQFHGAALCLALVRRSHELRYDDPAKMLQLAQLAVFAASRLGAGNLGAARLADVQARAWGALGNAERISGDLTAAEGAIDRAFDFLEQGTRDPLLEADLLSIQAVLCSSQRRFPQALELLERVEATYTAAGDRGLLGRAIIQRGIYVGYSGDPEGALRLLRRGLELVDEAANPELALTAVHSIAWFLMEAGRLRESRAILWKNRERYERHAGRIILLKRTWLQGQISAGLGELDRAGERLAEAMRGFEEAQLGYHSALAALDLAAVWLRQGKPQMAARLVEQAADTFAALRIGREAIRALRLLQQACEQQLATASFLQRVSTFLRRLEHDPHARFEKVGSCRTRLICGKRNHLMEHDNKGADFKGTIEEKRLVLDERRLALDSTFARKWLPTLATVMAGLIAGLFSYVQQQNSVQATERARIEATARAEREWGFKVVEMYFGKRELFDFTKNAEQAELNLRVLAAVAPKAVRGVLDAERQRIPPPTGGDDTQRLDSLAAVAGVEEALADAKQGRQTL